MVACAIRKDKTGHKSCSDWTGYHLVVNQGWLGDRAKQRMGSFGEERAVKGLGEERKREPYKGWESGEWRAVQ